MFKINLFNKKGKVAEVWIKIKFFFIYKVALIFDYRCFLQLKDCILIEIQTKLEICTYLAYLIHINWLSLQHCKVWGKQKQKSEEKVVNEVCIHILTFIGIIFVLSLKLFLQFYQDSPCAQTRLRHEQHTMYVCSDMSIRQKLVPNIWIV